MYHIYNFARFRFSDERLDYDQVTIYKEEICTHTNWFHSRSGSGRGSEIYKTQWHLLYNTAYPTQEADKTLL